MQKPDLLKEKLINYFKGSYTGNDLSEIISFFNDKKNEEKLRGYLSDQFSEILSQPETNSRNLDNVLYKIHYDINTNQQNKNISIFDNFCKWSARIAGVILIPVLVFLLFQTKRTLLNDKTTWAEIHSPAWTRTRFSLPDGTTGWLNSSSVLRYRGDFIKNRELELKGEAFFDVTKDAVHPFAVRAGGLTVTVLGTKFNIASYDNEGEVEVVLNEGKLIVNDQDRDNSVEMKPDEMVRFNKTNGDLISEVVQSQKYISWKEGKLVFRNDPFDVVARRLERWYNIDVELKGNISHDLRLRATFVDESLEDVLYLLKCSLPISYEIGERGKTGDEIYTKKKVLITINK